MQGHIKKKVMAEIVIIDPCIQYNCEKSPPPPPIYDYYYIIIALTYM